MAISRQKKEEILSKLSDVVTKVPTAIFVNFHGLSVGEVSDLRKSLRHENILYTVAKKTLLKRALQGTNIAGEIPELTGEVGIAYPVQEERDIDITSPARGVYTFQKKYEGKFSILGGMFEGSYLNRDGMLEIATIPSQHTLYGMFVNVINSPIQGLAIALDQIAQKKN